MKVLLAAFHTSAGGIRTYLRYLYGRDAFADCEFRLVAPDDTLGEYLGSILPAGRVTVRATAPSNRALYHAVRGELGARRYDVVHSHGFTAGIMTAAATLGRRVPHVMTGHDTFNEAQFSGWKGRLKKRAIGLAFSRVDIFHTVTQDATANFARFFPEFDDDRFRTILHGVDTSYFAEGPPVDLHEILAIDRGVPLIGFFGRFMAPKGFRDLVDAMAIIVDRRLADPLPRVVTFGWGGFIREDFAYIQQHGLSEHFTQAPHTDDMPGAIKGVDVVAMPSRWEACGLLAMEALAAGAPIVGTSCRGLREVLTGSPAYVVVPGDPAALADALMRALHGGRAAFSGYQSAACERFSVDRVAREIRDVYGLLAGNSGSR
jgi:glycosyltransferase involved in cell wall biosynthesis